jgi:hypothetical protein
LTIKSSSRKKSDRIACGITGWHALSGLSGLADAKNAKKNQDKNFVFSVTFGFIKYSGTYSFLDSASDVCRPSQVPFAHDEITGCRSFP